MEFVVRPEWAAAIPLAVGLVPGVCGVMGAAFEHKRGGVLVHRVMKCADEPLCIAVAVPKGHRLATLIRDSHAFSISLLEHASKLALKKFASEEEGDPYDTFPVRTLATGSPILVNCIGAFDCEVMRHFDLEADHEMYVGQVIAAIVHKTEPATTARPSASGAPSLPDQPATRPGEDARPPRP